MSAASTIRGPASSPCGSCPYRKDVPSGVWSEDEYEKLPPYDGATWAQPVAAFLCHQQDGRLCAGWAGCHDMAESFGLRMLAANGQIDRVELDATLDYVCPVPLFASGAEAAEHGLAELDRPSEKAIRTIDRLERKLRAR